MFICPQIKLGITCLIRIYVVCSETVAVIDFLKAYGFVLVGEVSPFAVVFQALHVLGSQFHLGEFLREMLGAILVVKLWLVRSLLFLFIDGVPVDAGEPRMSHDLFSISWTRTESCSWVLLKEFAADVSSILTQEWEV